MVIVSKYTPPDGMIMCGKTFTIRVYRKPHGIPEYPAPQTSETYNTALSREWFAGFRALHARQPRSPLRRSGANPRR